MSAKITWAFALLSASILAAGCAEKNKCGEVDRTALSETGNTLVLFETNKGCFAAELYDGKAPQTVANIKRYVEEKFYDNNCFHRVIPGFVVQGGGFDRSSCGTSPKPTHEPVPLETTARLRNEEKTLAMARTSDPNSATSQFFVNTITNCFLDAANYSTCPERTVDPENGYAVFGKVIRGWDTVKALESIGTPQGTPKETVYMISVRVV